jgi:uncharacterized membrane protein YfcA
MGEVWTIGCIIGLAALVQSLTGFGFALVAVSLLPMLMDLQAAVPLIVMTSLLANLLLCWYYRKSLDWVAILRLLIAALITIPVGILGLQYVPEHLALRLLGLCVLLYVIYDGLKFSLPELTSPRWAYAFGAISGVLTGAFNTGGPPVVIYANCNRWSPEQFKSNMPGVFAVSSVIAVVGHYWQGNLTAHLFQSALYSVPFFAGGLGVGIFISRWINAQGFRQMVLVLLGIMSCRLLW